MSASPRNCRHYKDCSCRNNSWSGYEAKFGLKSPVLASAQHLCPPQNFAAHALRHRFGQLLLLDRNGPAERPFLTPCPQRCCARGSGWQRRTGQALAAGNRLRLAWPQRVLSSPMSSVLLRFRLRRTHLFGAERRSLRGGTELGEYASLPMAVRVRPAMAKRRGAGNRTGAGAIHERELRCRGRTFRPWQAANDRQAMRGSSHTVGALRLLDRNQTKVSSLLRTLRPRWRIGRCSHLTQDPGHQPPSAPHLSCLTKLRRFLQISPHTPPGGAVRAWARTQRQGPTTGPANLGQA
jgi:hypothetical protein